MGLGELLSGLFGGSESNKVVVNKTGGIARVVQAVANAAEAATGKKVPPEFKQKAVDTYTSALELMLKPTTVGNLNDITKLVDDGDKSVDEAAADAADMFMAIATGRTAELQMEEILGIKIDESMPFTAKLSSNMGIVTDVALGSSIASIVAEVASVGQIDRIGGEIRSYLDYSGMSQITGFGYGMILSTALQPVISQEINDKLRATLLQPDLLTILLRRGLISVDDYNRQMGLQGYSEAAIAGYVNATEFYPSGTDFITFAVRDVFNPAVVESGGLDEAFPVDIVPFAEKAGMPEEILKWYWRAHWQLPSPQMGYEMLHRGLISEDDLRQLLRAADWAPGWIDALMSISYSPLTRVDARRMWEMGVLDDEGYKQAMRDIGYNDENAQLYLDWVKAEKPKPEKDLTQTMVLQAYKTGLMTRDTAIDYIKRFGYDDAESELIITLEDQKIANAILNDKIGLEQWLYSRGEIVEDTFLKHLADLGIDREKAVQYLTKAEADKTKRTKLPPIESVKKWYSNGLITLAEAKDYLTRLGYRAKERDLFIEEWGI